ncbi:ferredoxin family protein [Pseudomonas sp. dw_358]|uniref:4Fe-4S dicluster domain-containing protein n=1 Tax=Pseudomonas sp. dw_358 TaxID=2720083 RepID=UPI001BD55CF6|nr:ferredoxin family protein [Pseudomonas sp. dw_358]
MNTHKCLDTNRPSGRVIPVVDFSRCEGKDACVIVCPYDVFKVQPIEPSDYKQLSFLAKIKNRVHRGLVAYTPNADQCHACGLCVTACPEQAIKLVNVGRAE